MSLSILERRLQHRLPSDFAEDVAEEFCKYEIESSRISEKENKSGQASLTDNEIRKLNTTNQHGNDGLTVIEYQCIKAKAMDNGIMNWIERIDSSLSYSENLSLMERDTSDYNKVR